VGWEVVFAPRCEHDLADIVSYIAKDNPETAVRFGETLIRKAKSLADAPEIGALLPGKPKIRFLPVGAYLIIYRPDKDRRVVRIFRFWHSARRAWPTQ
jgi:plasmid stabilization system protein ParE